MCSQIYQETFSSWTSLAVHWLRFCISNAKGAGLIPGCGTKEPISHSVWQKKKDFLLILTKLFDIRKSMSSNEKNKAKREKMTSKVPQPISDGPKIQSKSVITKHCALGLPYIVLHN